MGKNYVFGVDFGGTKIAFGLFGQNCVPAASGRMETRPDEGAEKVFRRLGAALRNLAEQVGIPAEEIAAAGLCSPGPVDLSSGKIVYIASIGWRDVPAAELLARELGVPVVFENDANAAAFAERFYGAGRDLPDDAVLLYLTVSTGVGCGIITGDSILHGLHDSAGELGHLCVEPDGIRCNCGNLGCLEMYASGTAIARRYRELLPKGAERGSVTCRAVEEAARSGDALAKQAFSEAGEKLGLGVSCLVQILDPHRIVIGGGVANAWDLFYHDMIKQAKRHVYQIFSGDIRAVRAELGQEAGLIGAAAVAWKRVRRKEWGKSQKTTEVFR